MKTTCKTVDVLTVVTGIILVKGADFQGVMDVLYPGIFTLGCAAMQASAAEEIQRQHPAIREFLTTESPEGRLDEFISQAVAAFGESIEIDGPHSVSNSQIQTAFNSLSK